MTSSDSNRSGERRGWQDRFRRLFRDGDVHKDWFAELILVSAVAGTLLVAWATQAITGLGEHRAMAQDIELRRREVEQDLALRRIAAKEAALQAFANEMPRNLWYLSQIARRSCWQAEQYAAMRGMTPVQQWMAQSTVFGERYPDGRNYAQTAAYYHDLLETVYNGEHYNALCAVVQGRFDNTAIDEFVVLIRDCFDLMNEASPARVREQSDRFVELVDRVVACGEGDSPLLNQEDCATLIALRDACRGGAAAGRASSRTIISGCFAAIDSLYNASVQQMYADIEADLQDFEKRFGEREDRT